MLARIDEVYLGEGSSLEERAESRDFAAQYLCGAFDRFRQTEPTELSSAEGRIWSYARDEVITGLRDEFESGEDFFVFARAALVLWCPALAVEYDLPFVIGIKEPN